MSPRHTRWWQNQLVLLAVVSIVFLVLWAMGVLG
jgi:hypothetical protein